MEQQPPYRQKIYNALKEKVEGFNLSPEQFNERIKDQQYQKNVYNALKEKVEGFSLDENVFYDRIAEKKKESVTPTVPRNPVEPTTEEVPGSQKSNVNLPVYQEQFEKFEKADKDPFAKALLTPEERLQYKQHKIANEAFQKTQSKNDPKKFVEYQEQRITQEAQERGYENPQQLKQDRKLYQADFLNDKDRGEYNLVEQLNSIPEQENIVKGRLKGKELDNAVNSLNLKKQEIQKQLNNYRIDRIKEIEKRADAEPNPEKKEEILREKENFFKDHETAVQEIKGQTDIQIQNEESMSGKEKFEQYYDALYQEYADLRQQYEGDAGDNGLIKQALSKAYYSTIGGNDEGINRLYKLKSLLKQYAPIALLNRSPDYNQDIVGATFFKSFGKTFSTYGQGFDTDLEKAQQLHQALGGLDIEKDVNQKDALQKAAMFSPEEGYKDYGLSDPEYWSRLIGTTTAIIAPFAIGSPITSATLRGTQTGAKLISLAQKGLNPRTLINIKKYGEALTKTPTLGKAFAKSTNFLVKHGAGAAKTGVEYKIPGLLFTKQEDELYFTSGAFGYAGEKLITSFLPEAKRLVPIMKKMFGDKGMNKAVDVMVRFGKTAGRGVGETGEEIGNELANIHRDSNGDFFNQLEKRFGTFEETSKFLISSFIMGMGMGIGTLPGKNSLENYSKGIKELKNSNPDQAKKVEDAVIELTKDYENAAQEVINTDQSTESPLVTETIETPEIEELGVSENQIQEIPQTPEIQQQNQQNLQVNEETIDNTPGEPISLPSIEAASTGGLEQDTTADTDTTDTNQGTLDISNGETQTPEAITGALPQTEVTNEEGNQGRQGWQEGLLTINEESKGQNNTVPYFETLKQKYDDLTKSLDQLKIDNPNQFKKDGTPKANSKITNEYNSLIASRENISSEMAPLMDDYLLQKERDESEKSRLETEKLNTEFESLNKNDDQSLDEKIDTIFEKVSNGETPTQEEINYVNENAFLPKGYKFTETGLAKGERTIPIKKSKTRKEKANDLLAEGFDDLMEALGGKSNLTGEKRKSVVTALGKIGRGLIEQGIATTENVVEKIKEYLQSKGQNIDINELSEEIIGEINAPKQKESTEKKEAPKKEKTQPQESQQSQEPQESTKEKLEGSGIKKALVPDSKVQSVEIEKRSNKEVLETGKQLVDNGDILPEIVIQEIIENPRALQPEEVAALVYYKAKLDNEYNKTASKLEQAMSEQDEKEVQLRVQLDAINARIDAYHEMALITAYQQSLAFRLRQMLLNSEYNLQSQIIRYKAANRGEITPEIMQKFNDLEQQLKEANRKLTELQETKSQREEEFYFKAIQEIEKRKRAKLITTEKKKKISDFFDSLKVKETDKGIITSQVIPGITLLPKVWNGTVEAMKQAILTGADVANALQAGIDYIYANTKDAIDEDAFKKEMGPKLANIMPKEETIPPARMVDGRLIIPDKLIKSIVQDGVQDVNELTRKVMDVVKNDFPDVTERQVRDAITGYGKTLTMSKDEIDIEIRKLKRAGKAVSALEDISNKKRPLRSGLQRDKLSNEERKIQREIREAMKQLPMEEAEVEKQWKTSLDAVKSRLKNQIADLEKQIETGEKTPKKEGIKYDEEANSLKEKRDALKKVIEETEGKPAMSDEQRLRNAIAAAKRSITDLEERILTKTFTDKPSKKPIQSPELDALNKRREELRQTLTEIEKESGVADKKRLELYKKNIQKSIKTYQERIVNKDFQTKVRTKPNMDEEAKELEKRKLEIKDKFDLEVEKAKRQNRSNLEKGIDAFVDVVNLPKSLQATADFSAPLRQGAILSYSNPVVASKAFVEMFRQAFLQKKYEDFLLNIKVSDNYQLMRASKLYLSEPTASLAAKEEAFISNIARKVPIWGRVVKGSERAYTGYLNKLRVDVFNSLADTMIKNGYNPEKDMKPFKDLAKFINNASGRGDLGALERSAPILNALMFSPRYVASRFNLLWIPTYFKMDKFVAKEAIKSMLIYVGATSTIISLVAAWAGDDDEEKPTVELDPRSADFAKIKIGNARYDLWAGFQQTVRVISQLVSGQTKSTNSGKIYDLNPEKQTIYSQTRFDVALNFLRSKASPTTGLVWNFLDGKNMIGEPFNRTINYFGYEVPTELMDKIMPLYMNDMIEIYQKEGLYKTSKLTIPSVFGVGVQYYDSNSRRKKPERPKIAEPKFIYD